MLAQMLEEQPTTRWLDWSFKNMEAMYDIAN